MNEILKKMSDKILFIYKIFSVRVRAKNLARAKILFAQAKKFFRLKLFILFFLS
jgi:hypothetical protein